MIMTIEGWRDSVKGKRKLHAVGVEYNKYEVPILVNVSGIYCRLKCWIFSEIALLLIKKKSSNLCTFKTVTPLTYVYIITPKTSLFQLVMFEYPTFHAGCPSIGLPLNHLFFLDRPV